MGRYQKRITAYKALIQNHYVKESSIQNVIQQTKIAGIPQDHIRISYFEFLLEQSKFIRKKWWGLQGSALILLWLLLQDSGSTEYMERTMGILATIFVILIIPEVWKNRKYSAVEIERTSFYSLRQICAARTILFAIVDSIMILVFFMVTFHTMQISIYKMVINFLIPFNVSSCICFRLLYSKWIDTEYVAVFISMIWIIIWSVIVSQDTLYQKIAEPIWLGFVLLSFGFLIYFIRKSWFICEEVWEDHINGINV
ncbi:MAG: hypothetical protein K2J67_12405 [Lachnospiraceae bacterium]|nr:hypothetical protein [Lachnospiraceae bacterium]